MAPIIQVVLMALGVASFAQAKKLNIDFIPHNSEQAKQPKEHKHFAEGACNKFPIGFDTYEVAGFTKNCKRAWTKYCFLETFSDLHCHQGPTTYGNILNVVGAENRALAPNADGNFRNDTMAKSAKLLCSDLIAANPVNLTHVAEDYTTTPHCCTAKTTKSTVEGTKPTVMTHVVTFTQPLPDASTTTEYHAYTINEMATKTQVLVDEITTTETVHSYHWVTETPKPVTVEPSFEYSIEATTLSKVVKEEPTTFSWMHMGATYTTTLPAQVETVVLDVYGPVVVEGTATSTRSTTTTTITLPTQQTEAVMID